MGKYITIGAIIGSIIGWVTGFTIVTGLVIGAIAGGISYTMNSRRNIDKPTKKTNEIKEQTLQLREEQLDIKKNEYKRGRLKFIKKSSKNRKRSLFLLSVKNW